MFSGVTINGLDGKLAARPQKRDASKQADLKSQRHLKVVDKPQASPSKRNPFNDFLVRIAVHKDRRAFQELYLHFAPRVKSFVLKGGLTDEEAEEIAQETLMMVWRKAGQFNPDKAAASTWIFTIARNKKIDFHRRTNKPALKEEDFLHLASEDKEQDQQLALEEASQIVVDKLGTLPADQQEVIYKAFMEDKSHAVVAEELNLPLGTVKSRIRIALKKLRGDLAAHENSI